ncbi:MAG: hypothetical protein AAGI03_00715 [Pseudomonadota bacterium]
MNDRPSLAQTEPTDVQAVVAKVEAVDPAIKVEKVKEGEVITVDPPAVEAGKAPARGPDGKFVATPKDDDDAESTDDDEPVSADESDGDDVENTKAAEAAEAAEPEKGGDSQDSAEIPHGIQKRIGRANEGRRKAEQEAQAAQDKLATQEAELSKQNALVAAYEKADKLNVDDFDDWEKYTEARNKIIDDAKAAKPEPKPDDTAPQTTPDGVPLSEFQAAFETFKETIADADQDLWEAVQDDSFKISAGMVVAIGAEPDPALVLKHLHENPSESARIARLTPTQASQAIMRLGMRLETMSAESKPKKASEKPKAKASDAPEPPNPVGGKGKSQEITSAEAKSYREFEQARQKEIASRTDNKWI